MADESYDASNIEQLVICIHRVDKEMTVCEKYIGLLPVSKTNADTIVICIKDVLLRMNLRISDSHGQCNDGCLTMTGTKNGVVAQIKKLNEMSADALLWSLTACCWGYNKKKSIAEIHT